MRAFCPFTGQSIIYMCILTKYITDTALFFIMTLQDKTVHNNSHADATNKLLSMYSFPFFSQLTELLIQNLIFNRNSHSFTLFALFT